MANYKYSGKDGKDKINGVIEAKTLAQAKKKIREKHKLAKLVGFEIKKASSASLKPGKKTEKKSTKKAAPKAPKGVTKRAIRERLQERYKEGGGKVVEVEAHTENATVQGQPREIEHKPYSYYMPPADWDSDKRAEVRAEVVAELEAEVAADAEE